MKNCKSIVDEGQESWVVCSVESVADVEKDEGNYLALVYGTNNVITYSWDV